MKVIRKSVIGSILMLAVCILGIGVIFSKKDAIEIPVPDQILIYKNGVAYDVNPDSKDFQMFTVGVMKSESKVQWSLPLTRKL